MKTLIVLTLFTFSYLFSYSQYYLGFTPAEAKKSIDFPTKSGLTKDGYTYLTWNKAEVDFYLYFNETGLATMFVMAPTGEHLANYISLFNKDAVKESETVWKQYLYGRVILIRLEYHSEHDFYTFVITDITPK